MSASTDPGFSAPGDRGHAPGRRAPPVGRTSGAALACRAGRAAPAALLPLLAAGVVLALAVAPCATGGGPQPDPRLEELHRRYSARIHVGLTSADIQDAVFAMNELLDEWDPVGHHRRDVVYVVGDPTEASPDSLLYRFDSGFGGWEWLFALQNQVVRDVERRSLE